MHPDRAGTGESPSSEGRNGTEGKREPLPQQIPPGSLCGVASHGTPGGPAPLTLTAQSSPALVHDPCKGLSVALMAG